jgi:hypothetical protein
MTRLSWFVSADDTRVGSLRRHDGATSTWQEIGRPLCDALVRQERIESALARINCPLSVSARHAVASAPAIKRLPACQRGRPKVAAAIRSGTCQVPGNARAIGPDNPIHATTPTNTPARLAAASLRRSTPTAWIPPAMAAKSRTPFSRAPLARAMSRWPSDRPAPRKATVRVDPLPSRSG